MQSFVPAGWEQKILPSQGHGWTWMCQVSMCRSSCPCSLNPSTRRLSEKCQHGPRQNRGSSMKGSAVSCWKTQPFPCLQTHLIPTVGKHNVLCCLQGRGISFRSKEVSYENNLYRKRSIPSYKAHQNPCTTRLGNALRERHCHLVSTQEKDSTTHPPSRAPSTTGLRWDSINTLLKKSKAEQTGQGCL